MTQRSTTRLDTKPQKAKEERSNSVRVVSSDQLLGDAGLLYIEHRGRHYQLRCTRRGKLILTS